MNQKRRSWIGIVGVLFLLLVIVLISVPNLLRSKMAMNRASPRMMAQYSTVAEQAENSDYANLPAERKLIRNAELSLQVKDLQAIRQQCSALVSEMGGYIEESDTYGESDQASTANVKLRVPAARLDEAIDRLKKLSIRADREKIETKDVTREYIDIDARLRNLQSEEQQYLAILKRASTVKDTLDVSQHLNDVRGQIDQVQGQLKYLSHQIEMSSIALNLHMNTATLSSIQWTPSLTARNALHDLGQGLADWADVLLSVLIQLPLILLWVITIAAAALVVWKPSRFVWRRFRKTQPMSQPATSD